MNDGIATFSTFSGEHAYSFEKISYQPVSGILQLSRIL